MHQVKIALVQAAPVFMNLDATLQRAHEKLADCVTNGAALVVFPETWLPGYPVWLDLAPGAALWDAPGARSLFRALCTQSVTRSGKTLASLQSAACEHGTHIVIGTHELDGGTLYNTSFFLAPDERASRYHRKLTPTYNERLIWGVGDGSTLFSLDTPFGKLGGLICWEHWLPLARAAMHAFNESVHVAQWPAVGEIHQLASRHYAFEGSCFVAASGCTMSRADLFLDPVGLDAPARALLEEIPGDGETLLRNGGSAVIGPDGEYLAGPVFGSRETLYATCSLDRIAEARLLLDTDGHYARPDVFHLSVNANPQQNVTFRR